MGKFRITRKLADSVGNDKVKKLKSPAKQKPKREEKLYLNVKDTPLMGIIDTMNPYVKQIIEANNIVGYKQSAGTLTVNLDSTMTVIIKDVGSEKMKYSIRDAKGVYIVKDMRG